VSERVAAAFPSLVEDADAGLLLADTNGSIVYANGACERILGYPPSDLVGRIGFDFCRPEHLAFARERFDRSLAHPNVPVTFAVEARHQDNTFRRLAVKLVNRVPSPEVGMMVVQLHEQTAPPAAEPGTDPYRLLFEYAPIGLGVASLDGTLLAFNDAMLGPGGYTRQDIVQLKNVANLYADPADRTRVLALAQEQGYLWREPVRFRRKDGSAYDAILTLSPISFTGRRCWYAAVEDVSEQRHLESQLRQAQKMEEIGRLAGGVAHDFNNLLSVILLFSQAAKSSLETSGTVDRDDIAGIEEAARSGAAMATRLLGFSRRAELAPVPTDLAAVVRGLATMLRRILPEDVQLAIAADTPVATVRADPRALEEMLLNLVTNASDAMPAGGGLLLSVEDAILDAAFVTAHPGSHAGTVVCVTVADSGFGMDEQTRSHLFEPFFTTKPPGKGTGLGLPMVYGLTKQQHGFVDIASTPGVGTVVRLYFPTVVDAPLPTPARTSHEDVRGGTETILLVEDDAALRASVRRVLTGFGYTVIPAVDGVDALARYREEKSTIDLVVSDIVMPRMSGPHLHQALLELDPAVKFMFVTGYGGADAKARAVRDPRVPCLEKPWELQDLLATIRRALGS
jgi:PAS domain S-box-containing protein